jgi:hypothetical protein
VWPVLTGLGVLADECGPLDYQVWLTASARQEPGHASTPNPFTHTVRAQPRPVKTGTAYRWTESPFSFNYKYQRERRVPGCAKLGLLVEEAPHRPLASVVLPSRTYATDTRSDR